LNEILKLSVAPRVELVVKSGTLRNPSSAAMRWGIFGR
jgi:hypothetical protein